MKERTWRLLLAIALTHSFACVGDGIGRALVGELPPAPKPDGCTNQLECRSIAAAFVSLREAITAPAVGSNCATLDLNVDDSLLNLRCMRWNLTLTPEAGRVITSLTTQFAELHLFAERPARVVLIGASLSETQIVLHGPVTLRIEQGSLNNVQLLDDGSGQASFELLESDARGLVLGDTTRDFAGRAVSTRSAIVAGKLMTRSLRLENTQLHDTALVAEELLMQTVHGRKLRVEVERGTLGTITVEDLWIQRCGDLQISNARLQKLLLVPCSTELYIDRSDVLEGSIAGRIASKETSFRGLSFGAGLATELELWGGAFTDNVLCDNLQHVALAGPSQCTLCPTLSAAISTIACRVSKEADEDAEMIELLAKNPECPGLDQAPPCDPAPEDEYPF